MKLRRVIAKLRKHWDQNSLRSPRVNDTVLASLGTIVRTRVISTDSLAFAPPGHQLRLLGEIERELETMQRLCEAISASNDAIAGRARDIRGGIEAAFGVGGEVRALLEFWPGSWDLVASRVSPLLMRLTRLHTSGAELLEVARLRDAYLGRARTLRASYEYSTGASLHALLAHDDVERTAAQMTSLSDATRAMQRLDIVGSALSAIRGDTDAAGVILGRLLNADSFHADEDADNRLHALREAYLKAHWDRLMRLEECEERRANELLSLLRRPNARTAAMRSRQLFGGEQDGALHRWVLLHFASPKQTPAGRA